jgi:hypothetical protein
MHGETVKFAYRWFCNKIVGLAVRIFTATTRTFTMDTALSEQGKDAAWYVWINARHDRGTAWECHGRSMGTAWARHAMCESAFIGSSEIVLKSLDHHHGNRFSWNARDRWMLLKSVGCIYTSRCICCTLGVFFVLLCVFVVLLCVFVVLFMCICCTLCVFVVL